MSAAPFAKSARSIPVTIVTGGDAPLPEEAGIAVVRVTSSEHAHAPGTECPACAASGDVRVALFELLEKARLGLVPPFETVVVDARGHASPQAIADRLIPGRQPAFGLRDHTVARSFHLA